MSGEINVLSRTQIIEVDPSSGTVSVINAGPPGIGVSGLSAYQIAVANGFVGTQAEWLATLGGIPGPSAYDVAVDNGFVGTEAAWLASLEGDPGPSAYEEAVANGFVGTEAEWLDSLVGPSTPATIADATDTTKGVIQFGVGSDLEGPAEAPIVPNLRAHVDPENVDPHPGYASDTELTEHVSEVRPSSGHAASGISVDVSELVGLTLDAPDVQAVVKALNTRSLPSDLGQKEKDFYFTGALSVGQAPAIYPAPPVPQAFLGARAAVNTPAVGGDVVFTIRQGGSATVHPANAVVRSSQVRTDPNANTASYNLPTLGVPGDTTVRVGDLLLIFATCQGDRFIPVPTGFTQVDVIVTTTANASGTKTYVFRKKADATDAPASGSAPVYTLNLRQADLVTAFTGRSTARILAIKNAYIGANEAGVFAVAVSATSQLDVSTSVSYSHPGVTPTGPGHLALLAVGVNTGSSSSSVPTLGSPAGMTLIGKHESIMASQLVASITLPDDSRAASGAKVVTSTVGARFAGVMVSIRPLRPTIRSGQQRSDFEAGPLTDNIFTGFISANGTVTVEIDTIGDTGTTGADATVTMRIRDSV